MSSSHDQYRQEQYQWFQQQSREQPQQPWDRAAYPPNNSGMNPSPNSTNTAVTNATYQNKVHENMNELRGRTPSPTPSELKELTTPLLDWKTLTNWRFWIRREWLWYYVILAIILIITALISIFHTQIVNWLTPFTKWLSSLKFGWLVPIGILFVISFPPLFGHEIVAILCGLVWGLWIGFGIVAAGTFIGEVGNFYAFKYCCRSRGEKLERTNIMYSCLAKVVREGGFKIALIARLSAIPGHFTTAVFSTCGMSIFTFSIAAILSLPKQFITVYLGVILEESGTGQTDTKSRVVSDVVLAITFIITIAAMWYLFREMGKVKPQVIYERRKARQAKLYQHNNSTDSTMSFNPNQSDSNIPLHQRPSAQYPFGREFQYGSGQPQQLYAPRPQQVNQYGYLKDDDLASDESGSTEYGGPHRGQPQPRQSTEEVAWDTGRHEQPESRYGVQPRRTMSPESYNAPIQQQQQQPLTQYAQNRAPLSPVNTPKQSGYAINYQAPTASTVVPSPSLPTPSYPTTFAQQQQAPASPAAYYTSPSSQPQQYHHEVEPTGMSYHTADGSEASVAGGFDYIPNPHSNPSYNQQQQRVHSPPPPSYRTDAYGHPMS